MSPGPTCQEELKGKDQHLAALFEAYEQVNREIVDIEKNGKVLYYCPVTDQAEN